MQGIDGKQVNKQAFGRQIALISSVMRWIFREWQIPGDFSQEFKIHPADV